MVEVFYSLLGPILGFAFFSVLLALSTPSAAAVARDELWVSPPSGVSACTMCVSCDNPCHPLPPRAVPSPTPPSSSYSAPPPPPPSGSYYFAPPPPQGYVSYPPPYAHYPGPPPPNPIMPYFPFYYYSPPPPSGGASISGSSSPLLPRLPYSRLPVVCLLFLPFLFLF